MKSRLLVLKEGIKVVDYYEAHKYIIKSPRALSKEELRQIEVLLSIGAGR